MFYGNSVPKKFAETRRKSSVMASSFSHIVEFMSAVSVKKDTFINVLLWILWNFSKLLSVAALVKKYSS